MILGASMALYLARGHERRKDGARKTREIEEIGLIVLERRERLGRWCEKEWKDWIDDVRKIRKVILHARIALHVTHCPIIRSEGKMMQEIYRRLE